MTAAAVYVTFVALVFGVCHARLVFPPGSDVGYIVSDDPETKFDDTNGINELDNDQYAEQLLHRGERGAKVIDLNSVHSALLQAFNHKRRELDGLGPEEDAWLGKWFPHAPGVNRLADVPAKTPTDLPENMKDDKHGVAMGVPHVKCDDGQVNVTIDWDGSPINFTCFDSKRHRIPVQENLKSVQECVDIPKDYVPQHYCMNREIEYNTTLPVFGSHRPLWPTYGEYVFIPPQRWLHAIEHGAVVMLYHPCAEPVVVQRLRKILVDCVRKHVITPYTHLTPERPLALVAWGCSLEMATVDDQEVKTFIKERALHGPEGHMAKDGNFRKYLIKQSTYPEGADGKDRNICPMDEA